MSGTFSLEITGPLSDLRRLAVDLAGNRDPSGAKSYGDAKEAVTVYELTESRNFWKALAEDSTRTVKITGAERDGLKKRVDELLETLAETTALLERAGAEVLEEKAARQKADDILTNMAKSVETLRGEARAYQEAACDLGKENKRLKAALAAIDIQIPNAPASPIHVSVASEELNDQAQSAGVSEEKPPSQEEVDAILKEAGLTGSRGDHFAFIVRNNPTFDEFQAHFKSPNRQQVHNRISEIRSALKGRFVVDGSCGRVHVSRVEPPAVKVATASVEAASPSPASLPAPIPAEVAPEPAVKPIAPPAAGNLCRVSVHLLTAAGPKGAARLNSSLFAKMLAHMADGNMYGIDKLRQVRGYANNDAVGLAFSTHKAVLARIGLEIYADKINARLRVIG